MTRVTIIEKEGEKVGISPKTAIELGIDIGQILLITDPNSNRKTVGITELRQNIPDKSIEMDRVMFESIGLDSGLDVDIEPYYGELISVNSVEFGIMAAAGSGSRSEDVLITVKSHEDELLEFVGDRVFTKSSQFIWDEYGIIISIKNTTPKLQPGDVARFGELKSFSFGWAGTELRTFDGVLLIDISGSMKTKDMPVQEVGWAIERMKQELSHPTTSEFLKRFREGSYVMRYDGAALCALLYLVEKIGRGVGDNVAIILFSDDVHPIMFSGKPYYSSSMGKTDEAAISIVEKVETVHHGMTNMYTAFERAIEIAKGFDRGRIKMFVLLTDGKADNEPEVMQMLEERLAPRKDIILNTLGLGMSVNKEFLGSIAAMSGGAFNAVSGLRELTAIYGKYAADISVSGSTTVISDYVRKTEVKKAEIQMVVCKCCGRQQPLCTACNNGLRYVESAKEWYCDNCKAYPSKMDAEPVQKTVVAAVAQPAPQAGPQPEIKETEDAKTCPQCGNEFTYVKEYSSWYCTKCDKYEQEITAEPKVADSSAGRKCPKCNKDANYIEQYNRWYCYGCKEYL